MAKKNRRAGETFARIERTVNDLTTLEINTIIKTQMTGEKPADDDRTALYQLAGTYAVALADMGNAYRKLLDTPPKIQDGENLFRRVSSFMGGGIFSFRELHIWADYAIAWINQNANQLGNTRDEQTEDVELLKRISVKCIGVSKLLEKHLDAELAQKQQLDPEDEAALNQADFIMYSGEKVSIPSTINTTKARFEDGYELSHELKETDHEEHSDYIDTWHQIKRLRHRYAYVRDQGLYKEKEETSTEYLYNSVPFPLLNMKDRIAIQKALDLGLEHIVMQTRIGLDGDITTRISKQFSEKPVQFVLDMHNTSIDISVNYWSKIFDALMSFFNKVLRPNKQ